MATITPRPIFTAVAVAADESCVATIKPRPIFTAVAVAVDESCVATIKPRPIFTAVATSNALRGDHPLSEFPGVSR